MPTTLVLADRSAPYELTYELGDQGADGKCHVFNPGSFVGASYGWTTYHTDTRKSEPRYVANECKAFRGTKAGYVLVSCLINNRATCEDVLPRKMGFFSQVKVANLHGRNTLSSPLRQQHPTALRAHQRLQRTFGRKLARQLQIRSTIQTHTRLTSRRSQ